MAGWGSLAPSWQHSTGAADGTRAHPQLFEAFGANRKPGDNFGGFGGGAGAFADATDGLADEIPRVFSMKSPSILAGNADLAGPGAWASPVGLVGAAGAGALVAGTPACGDPCWVTVFGFPGRTSAQVRQQLEAICGPILEVCHGDGNFMHVRFHSASAASTCLAQNGRAILDRLLIGCVPCTSGLIGSEAMMGEPEEPELGPRPALQPATAGAPWSLSAGAVQGPKVVRGGALWRLLDLLFDI
mmetsp:Transcript_23160/g.66803  ORF Transcript_23160/g.66803 Transcript_23160/m.66803 type:complete len:244 (+) Transcript_23160:87-818(+)